VELGVEEEEMRRRQHEALDGEEEEVRARGWRRRVSVRASADKFSFLITCIMTIMWVTVVNFPINHL